VTRHERVEGSTSVRIVKAALVAASVAGFVAASTPVNAAAFTFRVPGTPCEFYTAVDTRVNPQERPPVNTDGTDVGFRCAP
jgi:hypothetical protein